MFEILYSPVFDSMYLTWSFFTLFFFAIYLTVMFIKHCYDNIGYYYMRLINSPLIAKYWTPSFARFFYKKFKDDNE